MHTLAQAKLDYHYKWYKWSQICFLMLPIVILTHPIQLLTIVIDVKGLATSEAWLWSMEGVIHLIMGAQLSKICLFMPEKMFFFNLTHNCITSEILGSSIFILLQKYYDSLYNLSTDTKLSLFVIKRWVPV